MVFENGKIVGGLVVVAIVSAAATWFLASGRDKFSNENSGADGPISNSVIARSRFDTYSPNKPDRTRASNRDPSQNSMEGMHKENVSDLAEPLGSAIATAESNGDFSQLQTVFDSLTQNERIGRFQEILSVYSKLGPKHDIEEKLALLEKVNAPASTLETFKRKIFEMEARERYGAMKEEGVLANLKDEEFGSVCRAVTTSRMKQGFQCVEDGTSESAKRTAAGMVARFAIQAGTMEASKEISALPPGIVRDEAVAEMVLWLRKTGSEKEAAPWLETIQDEKAKARAMGK